MPSKQYNSKLFKVMDGLEKDLAAKKITDKEFEMLLGLFLQHEFSKMVHREINELLPTGHDKKFGAHFINYQWKRTFHHA